MTGAADSAAGLPPELSGGSVAAAGDLTGLPPAGAVGSVDAAGNVVSDVGAGAGAVQGAGTTAAADQSSLFLGGTTAQPVGEGQTGAKLAGAAVTPNVTPTAPTVPVTQQPLPGPTPGVGGNAAAGGVGDMTAAAWTKATTAAGMIPTAGDSGGGAFSGLLDFAKNNQLVTYGAIQAGGALLSGLTNTVTPANVKLLESQAAANDAATAQQKMQTQNLQMPKAVASSVPVSGSAQLVPTPATPPPPVVQPSGPAGFINQNPVPSQPVTGVAA